MGTAKIKTIFDRFNSTLSRMINNLVMAIIALIQSIQYYSSIFTAYIYFYKKITANKK